MKITQVQTDGKALSTGQYMHHMVNTYHKDMLPFVHLTLPEVYDLIKNIPYRPDPPDVETLMRPCYTMTSQGSGGDCDDKAIALASYAVLKGIPYRFVAVRTAENKSLHHVYTQLYINSNWITADCTYNVNTLGRERVTYAQYVII